MNRRGFIGALVAAPAAVAPLLNQAVAGTQTTSIRVGTLRTVAFPKIESVMTVADPGHTHPYPVSAMSVGAHTHSYSAAAFKNQIWDGKEWRDFDTFEGANLFREILEKALK